MNKEKEKVKPAVVLSAARMILAIAGLIFVIGIPSAVELKGIEGIATPFVSAAICFGVSHIISLAA